MTALEFSYHVVSTSQSLKPFAVRLTKDYEDANDLLQETVLKAFKNQEKFSEGTNLKAWLYTIMKNTFLTNYQKAARKKTFIDTTDNLHFINSSERTINNNVFGTFASEEINKAMDQLDDVYKTPFMMHFKGYKYHEIADHFQIPIGTVKNRIHIARKELKAKLKNYANKTVVC